eukprot:COSAG06_NODE_6241_length_3015_cov_20.323288_4_plen_78_part_00
MPPRKKIVIPKFEAQAADTNAMWAVLDSAIKPPDPSGHAQPEFEPQNYSIERIDLSKEFPAGLLRAMVLEPLAEPLA